MSEGNRGSASRIQSALAAEPTEDGKARIHLQQQGKSVGHFDCDAPELAGIASFILAQANHLLARSGRRLENDRMPPLTAPIVESQRFGLAPHPNPEYQTVMVQVGEAVMGFSIHKCWLAPLGIALQAAAAPEKHRH